MKKIIYNSLLFLILLLFLFVGYFSIFGIETDRFNKQISNKIKNINSNIQFELKKVKLVLEPLKFKVKVKTLGPKIKSNNEILNIESIETLLSLKSLIDDKFALTSLDISTNSLEIKKLISFIRGIEKDTKFLILENFIKEGFLIADIKINFDDNGNIKNDYTINGFVKNGKIELFKEHKLDKINFIFSSNDEFIKLDELELRYNKIGLFLNKLEVKKDNKNYKIKGEVKDKNFIYDEKLANNKLMNDPFNIKNADLNINCIFSFNLDNKLKVNDLKIKSKAIINQLEFQNRLKLKQFLPNIQEIIKIQNHDLEFNYDKKKYLIKGKGNILFQKEYDKIDYLLHNKNNLFNFETSLKIHENPFEIDFLNFEKMDNVKTVIKIEGEKKFNDYTRINSFSLKDESSKIIFEDFLFNKNNKLQSFKNANFSYSDKENQKNIFSFTNKKNDYFLVGKFYNANTIIEKFLSIENDTKLNFFEKKFNFNINIDQVLIDKETVVNNFKGNLSFKNDEIEDANLIAYFEDDKEFKLTINSYDGEKTTTFISEYAKPFIKKYKFIKSFEDGILDYYSTKRAGVSESKLKIYDFKLKELPILTKVLSLASLQGIADLLTGEGIRFDEFEMSFRDKEALVTIDEIYAIGPAISVMIEGYIEKKKLISLRGTLVPATTLNKVIGSIPLFGQILVGSKTGEGVFGVSFKIKGPPNDLETTVNPIKTLTPRFITRTLEKIKKAN
tara:strand:- start:2793 stop:4982 length:2190 start_codon:yes stop_codon:yes gene_type:complete